ncbi:Uma2 family endonuclease [Alkalinema pantanalense CENA528]|uniref:Uma2 family endonuclease n=1 Tax=Alkalinema pantanalense TaxID=1620705 RepID=UPI003D701E79
MTVAQSPSPIRVETSQGDIRTVQWGRTWEQFKHLQKGFENTRGVRLFYYNGTIEILMPGEAHELFKSIIGFLIETFLFNWGIEFKPTGSMTQEKEGIAAAEADESYEIEGFKLAIEVNFTSGDASKLERYGALGVHEVWMWEDGVLTVYHLQSGNPEKVTHSRIPGLASIDLQVLSDCILIGETSRIKAAQTLLESHPVKPKTC